ncbi:uncharacterized protein APUU_40596S [Aspergillus puulaauensis]|uniref:Uncharacterized protein n=1 Tax=Aspergillus puulaauensis TaxID=1220207 RepID=A0A7R7XN03_9EURO|nr:uncharacterized protein APUU_40596S [Aspergillus puulaauensis]BCS24152.1 hypothetical protein APUU_40596S [Aspergillus puulaauensis]
MEESFNKQFRSELPALSAPRTPSDEMEATKNNNDDQPWFPSKRNVSMVHRSLASGPLQGRWIPFGNQTQTVQTVNSGVSKKLLLPAKRNACPFANSLKYSIMGVGEAECAKRARNNL